MGRWPLAGLAGRQRFRAQGDFGTSYRAIHELPLPCLVLSNLPRYSRFHLQGPGGQDGRAFLACHQPNKGSIAHAGSEPNEPNKVYYSKALFPVIFPPPGASSGREDLGGDLAARRPGSKHKLIMDCSALSLSNHVRLLVPCNRAGLHFWPPLVLCVTTLNEAMICHTFLQPLLLPCQTLTLSCRSCLSVAPRLLFSVERIPLSLFPIHSSCFLR